MFDELRSRGIARWGVNGTRESDWDAVLAMADEFPEVYPSLGLHPWYVRERTDGWADRLVEALERTPCGVGEIGLDKWIRDADLDDQEIVFRRQLEIADEFQRPITIHCLQCWGRLLEVLRDSPLPPLERGFLLHSYGGPSELIAEFIEVGARFSFSGYFLHERKKDVRARFRDQIPFERLLLETDAPAMAAPEEMRAIEIGKDVNHPGNLTVVYESIAEIYDVSLEALEAQMVKNFEEVFPG